MMTMPLGSWAEWAGAVGQLTTAAIAAWIAYKAFAHSRRSVEATSLMHLSNMVNEFNRMCIQDEGTIKATEELRDAVLGQPKDSLVYSYLNFLRANHDMHQAGLIPDEIEHGVMRNGVAWLAKLSKHDVERYLSRGYDATFQTRILNEFSEMSR